jgi:hypothetical protein
MLRQREAEIMSKSTEPHGVAGPRFRLDTGLALLEQWAATANEIHKNSVYKALFAVTDGSVFRNYIVFDDRSGSREFSIMIKEDLIMKVRIEDFDSFGIRYIGPVGTPSNLDLGINPIA